MKTSYIVEIIINEKVGQDIHDIERIGYQEDLFERFEIVAIQDADYEED